MARPNLLPTMDDDWLLVSDKLVALAEAIRTAVDDDARVVSTGTHLGYLTEAERATLAAAFVAQQEDL